MPNSVRDNRTSGVMRGSRDTIGMEGQDVRIGTVGNRDSHVSRGSYINYYDDLGISTTPDNAGTIRTQEKQFQSTVAEQQGKISTANQQLQEQYASGKAKIDSVSSGIGSANDVLNKAWNTTRSSFFPVRVVNGNTVEQTYYLPKSAADKLANDNNLHANYVDNGRFLNIEVHGKGGKTVGKELHTSLSQAEKDIYNTWYINNAGTVTKQVNDAQSSFNQQKQDAYNNLDSSYTSEYGKIAEAQGVIDSAVYKRAAEWEQLRDDYVKKKATIAEIFGNFKVEEAKPDEQDV